MLTQYDDITNADFIFICPWWLKYNIYQMSVEPYQPVDTRLTIYTPRNAVRSMGIQSLAQFREWRNNMPGLPETERGKSDTFVSGMTAADIRFLTAVCMALAQVNSAQIRGQRQN